MPLLQEFFRAIFGLCKGCGFQKRRESCKEPIFEPKNRLECPFLTCFIRVASVVRGFYVRAKYYFVESALQKKYARSILRKVQGKQGDQEPPERHAQERQ